MRALVFENSLPRQVITAILSRLTPKAFVGPLAPIRLKEIPEPRLLSPDWVVIKTDLCGLCGSDYKQVFLNGTTDNPMTAMVSFPHVLGHEVVGRIERVGPAVTTRKIGERVVLNPWLSCATRGLDPCSWCRAGELAQCLNFRHGAIAPGIHHGNSSDATGGFAPFLPAHASQCIAVPDEITDEQAVLADPFSVSLHAILHTPPAAGDVALVYGCGTLGLLAIAILRALHPNVRILAVARYPHQAALAERFGAQQVFRHQPPRAVIEGIAAATGVEIHEPWRGLPMLNGGVDIIYDTVTAPATLEIDVRVTRARGRIVCLGVEIPRRFEWTPLYFKELSIVGSNAFAIERLDGRRMHAMEWYFELVQRHALDVTPIITHRFRLEEYKQAFLSCYAQGASRAVKVLFDHRHSGGKS